MTLRQLQALEWKQFYAYRDSKGAIDYKAYAAKGAVGITAHHYKRGSRAVDVTYWVFGKRATSLAAAAKLYKRQRKNRANTAPAAVG